MSQYWESIAAKTDGQYTAEEFESTASRLLSEQALYYSDKNSRMAYGMVERFEREFRHVLSMVGVTLLPVNRQLQFACAVPDSGKAGTATTAQTLLALVLRKIYDEFAKTGQFNDNGEVVCDLVDLSEKYKASTGRELPHRGEMESLVRVLRRWGIVRKMDELEVEENNISSDGQPYVLAIRPAIVDLLGDTATSKLAEFHNAEEFDGEQPINVEETADVES